MKSPFEILRQTRGIRLRCNILAAGLFILLCPPSFGDVTNGLVAWYKCDGNANDSSGYSRSGTLTSVIATNDQYGVASSALWFNGASSYATMPNGNVLLNSTSLTFAYWICIAQDASKQPLDIISCYDGGAFVNGDIRIFWDGSVRAGGVTNGLLAQYGTGASAGYSATYDTQLIPGKWWHIAVSMDTSVSAASNRVVVYVNGKSIPGMVDQDNGSPNWPLGNQAYPVQFSAPNRFRGMLDDIRIYNRALSAIEVRQICGMSSLYGTVQYQGKQVGMIKVMAATNQTDWSATGVTTINSPGGFQIERIPFTTCSNYWLKAYLDANGNGSNDYWEPCGQYVGNPVLITNDVNGLTITLIDPDTDSDGMPDWWELKYFTNLTTAISNQDLDSDGLDNLHESWAGTDPRSPDTDGDGMPDGWEVLYGLNPLSSGVPSPILKASFSGYVRQEILTNFPCLLVFGPNITGFAYDKFLSPSGDDLRCFDSLTNELNYEIENWNTNGASYVWVQVPLMRSNDFITCSWGNAVKSNRPAYTTNGAAWASTYKGVWHLGENGGIHADSTTNKNIGIATNGVVQGTNGVSGKSDYFDGASAVVSLVESNNALSPSLRVTLSAWGYYDDNVYTYRGFVGKSPPGAPATSTDYDIDMSIDGQVRFWLSGSQYYSGSQQLIPKKQWFQVTEVYDGASLMLYLDGRLCTNLAVSGAISDNCSLRIGKGNWDIAWKGFIDEVRVMDQSISSNAVWANWAVVASNSSFLTYTLPDVLKVPDSDSDGLNDLQEYLLGSNPTNMDSDHGSIPDGWEVQNGMNPTNAADDQATIPGDLMTYLQKYQYGLNSVTNDTDGDGLTDYQELFIYGSSPTNSSTAGDGISDGWKVAHRMDPRRDYSTTIALDGLTMYQKYTNNLDPWAERDLGDGLSDYERIYGRKTATCYYDKIDRLVGIDYNHGANGLAIVYDYDGNGNIIHQRYLARDANTNGIPDAWEYLNGLSLTNSNPNLDSDGDGWTDYQEWLHGSDPLDTASTPGQGVAGINVGSFSFPFVVSNYVMATGDLNGDGRDEIVFSADGNPGTKTNSIYILSQGFSGWTTSRVDVVGMGVTSLAIGQPTNTASPGIYYGTRAGGGTGQVMQLLSASNGWQGVVLSSGNTGTAAYVLGAVQGAYLLASLSSTNAPDQSLFSLGASNGLWSVVVVDSNSSHRGLGRAFAASGNACPGIRLLDIGGIQAGISAIPNALYRATTGKNYCLSSSPMTWSNALAYARGLGGTLASIENADENAFLQGLMPGATLWFGMYRNVNTDKNNPAAWLWINGSSSGWRNWSVGQPDDALGPNNELCVQLYGNGSWNDCANGNAYYAILEFAPSASRVLIPEPSVINRINWRGHSLAMGYPRGGVTSSVFCACVDDVIGSGGILSGDSFVVQESQIAGTNVVTNIITRIKLGSPTVAQSYALASVQYTDNSGETLFTGEPDGRVYSWSASSLTGSLQRQLFSAQYAGKAWHQMEPVRMLNNQGEGLAGLCVDPTNSSVCNLVLWPPQPQLSQQASLSSVPPVTRLLPDVQQGFGVSRLLVRIWGGANYHALPEIQYSLNVSNGWTNATLLRIDGLPYVYTMFVDALPDGSTHSLLWYSGMDLPSNYVGSVCLRARSRDMLTQGDWSETVTYQVAVTPDSNNDGIPDSWVLKYGLDPLATNGSSHASGSADGTGIGNLYKYLADLDPTNPASQLMLTDIQLLPQGMRLNWKGGTWATQFLEVRQNLVSSGEQWAVIYTNIPPTATATNIIDAGATNRSLFYRIRATR